MKNVIKKCCKTLAFMVKVCTFATAFESETHERDEILTTECKPDILLRSLRRVSYLACCKGARKGMDAVLDLLPTSSEKFF